MNMKSSIGRGALMRRRNLTSDGYLPRRQRPDRDGGRIFDAKDDDQARPRGKHPSSKDVEPYPHLHAVTASGIVDRHRRTCLIDIFGVNVSLSPGLRAISFIIIDGRFPDTRYSLSLHLPLDREPTSDTMAPRNPKSAGPAVSLVRALTRSGKWTTRSHLFYRVWRRSPDFSPRFHCFSSNYADQEWGRSTCANAADGRFRMR
jgi:hypothetical protein